MAARDPLTTLDWVSLWAMAVNEENAAGGRVVTRAPTNGRGRHHPGGTCTTSCAFKAERMKIGSCVSCSPRGQMGILYKLNASISRARKSVARAKSVSRVRWRQRLYARPSEALSPRWKTPPRSVWNTTLGLTCDPIGGLVQVPCIERTAMGAVKAINAARLGMRGDGTHSVSLDKVIRTMRL